MSLEPEEQTLYELLKSRKDNQGIVRYEPTEFESELNMVAQEIEKALERLYQRGLVVYLTRINKETGEVLKVVQLIEEEEA